MNVGGGSSISWRSYCLSSSLSIVSWDVISAAMSSFYQLGLVCASSILQEVVCNRYAASSLGSNKSSSNWSLISPWVNEGVPDRRQLTSSQIWTRHHIIFKCLLHSEDINRAVHNSSLQGTNLINNCSFYLVIVVL